MHQLVLPVGGLLPSPRYVGGMLWPPAREQEHIPLLVCQTQVWGLLGDPCWHLGPLAADGSRAARSWRSDALLLRSPSLNGTLIFLRTRVCCDSSLGREPFHEH